MFKEESFDFGSKVYLLLILLFALFVLLHHTLYLEYDAISTFLPYSKSIALTGSMGFNVYDQSLLSTGMAPDLPVIYGWAFSTIDNLNVIGIQNDLRWFDLLRPVPATYFLLTTLLVYLIARETLQKKHAFISVIVFISFPSTILTLSAYTHYLDLGFIFYLASSLFCMIKAFKTTKAIWFFFTGVAGSLLLLAKELSIFIIPLTFSIMVLFSSIKYRRYIFVIFSTLPFYMLFIWDIFAFPISTNGWILIRQVPVFALSILLYYLSSAFKETNNILTKRNFIIVLLPFIPSIIFFLRGVLSLGVLYSSWGPGIAYPWEIFNGSSEVQNVVDMANFLRWDIPFLSLGLGILYLIPIALSIVRSFRRREKDFNLVNIIVLMTFFTLIEMASFTLVGSQDESRRMYYFAPLLAIITANGFLFFRNFLKSKYFVYLFAFFNSLAISYIWIYKFPFKTMLELSYLKTKLGLGSILDLTYFILLFSSLFLGIPLIAKRIQSFWSHNQVKFRLPRKSRFILLFSFVLSCLIATYPMITLWREGMNRNADFLSLQYDVYEPTYENGILIIGHYFSDNIDDPYITVCFGGTALRYFANRSVIDLANVRGVKVMKDILTAEVPENLMQALNSSKIRYFLIPRIKNSFYDLYLTFQESFFLFRFLEEDGHFSLVKEFDYYRLVRFDYGSA